MHSHSYLNTTQEIISAFEGSIPLNEWLKFFFKRNKKYGSTDRKQISHACFCFYRLGNAFANIDEKEKIVIALFLCSTQPNKILEELKPEWNLVIHISIEEKLKILSAQNEINFIMPFQKEMSEEIDRSAFNKSFLIQPDLFIRIRPGFEKKIIEKLNENRIKYSEIDRNCIQLNNQTKVGDVVEINSEAVIQDYSSQRVAGFFSYCKPQSANYKLSVWDCCAASGGKSILFHDVFPFSKLTVSDIRESILINLQKRFKEAGIKNYSHFIADVADKDFALNKRYDVVICDAPCSGSGTWSRIPEQLHFFKKEKISYYTELQKRIVSNACKNVKKNGFFLYITCSVFKNENEDIVKYIQQKLPLQLISMQYFKGYDRKADTLFASLFSAL